MERRRGEDDMGRGTGGRAVGGGGVGKGGTNRCARLHAVNCSPALQIINSQSAERCFQTRWVNLIYLLFILHVPTCSQWTRSVLMSHHAWSIFRERVRAEAAPLRLTHKEMTHTRSRTRSRTREHTHSQLMHFYVLLHYYISISRGPDTHSDASKPANRAA